MLQSKKIKIKAHPFGLFFKVLVFILMSQTSVVDIHILLYVAILIRLLTSTLQLIKFIYNSQLWDKYKATCLVPWSFLKQKKNIFLLFLLLIFF